MILPYSQDFVKNSRDCLVLGVLHKNQRYLTKVRELKIRNLNLFLNPLPVNGPNVQKC